VVGIPGQEDLGTADSLRKVGDRITGSDILVLSGDLLVEADILRRLTDIHRLNSSAFTATLAQPLESLGDSVIPGAKSTKYKKERDLVGLSDGRLCLFTAEADVEDFVKMKSKVLATHPRITVHSGLQDSHMYLMQRWICDYIIADKNISTIKGELLPIVVNKQFSRQKDSNRSSSPEDRKTLLDFLPPSNPWEINAESNDRTRYQCHVYQVPSTSVCLRVNTVPHYWEANKRSNLISGAQDKAQVLPINTKAEVGERAQLQATRVGEGTLVSNKTTLTNVQLGPSCKVEEKVRISNCVIMDNVVIESGSNLQDSIICDNCTVSGTVKNCIVGRGQVLKEGGCHESQTLLSKDRMMEV